MKDPLFGAWLNDDCQSYAAIASEDAESVVQYRLEARSRRNSQENLIIGRNATRFPAEGKLGIEVLYEPLYPEIEYAYSIFF